MVSIKEIQEAHHRIRSSILRTPIIPAIYSGLGNKKIQLKMENFQRTGSFKERGAANRLLLLPAKKSGIQEIVAASAGNHSQAVALHGAAMGYQVSIVMPKATPMFKISATEKWGAKVTLHGEIFDESLALAKQWAKERSAIFVHAYDDADIIAGQGTVGLEIVEQFPEVDCVIIPVGGGGLASGVSTALRALKPSCKIYGVQTEACARVYAKVKGLADPSKPTTTIADGIAVKNLGDLTIPILQKNLDDIVTVSEDAIAKAVMEILEGSKSVAEGAAAASVAALLEGKIPITEHTLCLISGGNIDASLLSRIIEKGLLRTHRLMHLEVIVSDRPGGLSALTALLAGHGANIWQIHHERAFADLGLDQTGTDLILQIRNAEHEASVLNALSAHGYVFTHRK